MRTKGALITFPPLVNMLPITFVEAFGTAGFVTKLGLLLCMWVPPISLIVRAFGRFKVRVRGRVRISVRVRVMVRVRVTIEFEKGLGLVFAIHVSQFHVECLLQSHICPPSYVTPRETLVSDLLIFTHITNVPDEIIFFMAFVLCLGLGLGLGLG